MTQQNTNFSSLILPWCAAIAIATWATTCDAAIGLAGMGVTVANNNGTTYAMAPGYVAGTNVTGSSPLGGSTLYFNIEDQNDLANIGGFLGPEYGGQAYDAEFMGAVLSGGQLSIAILTGQRFSNAPLYYSPGDIKIVTSAGTFWVEVGGSGAGAADNVVSLGENGSTYYLDSNGVTSTVGSSATITAGTIVKNPAALNAPSYISPAVAVQIDPAATPLAAIVGQATSYSYIFYSGSQDQHAGIELSLDPTLFGPGATIESIEWRPSCDNDELIIVDLDAPLPEPASALIWCSGLAALTLARRMRKR